MTHRNDAARAAERWKPSRFATVLLVHLVLAVACGDDTSSSPMTSDGGGRDPAGESTLDSSLGTPAADAGAAVVDAGQSASDAGSQAADATLADGGADASRPVADAAVDGAATEAGALLSAAALRGQALAMEHSCGSCHQANYAGAGFYPNITPDTTTGIGDWTDSEIGDAITAGMDEEGESLCAVMQRYELSATELADLIAFLRSVAPKSNEVVAVCPGHGS